MAAIRRRYLIAVAILLVALPTSAALLTRVGQPEPQSQGPWYSYAILDSSPLDVTIQGSLTESLAAVGLSFQPAEASPLTVVDLFQAGHSPSVWASTAAGNVTVTSKPAPGGDFAVNILFPRASEGRMVVWLAGADPSTVVVRHNHTDLAPTGYGQGAFLRDVGSWPTSVGAGTPVLIRGSVTPIAVMKWSSTDHFVASYLSSGAEAARFVSPLRITTCPFYPPSLGPATVRCTVTGDAGEHEFDAIGGDLGLDGGRFVTGTTWR